MLDYAIGYPPFDGAEATGALANSRANSVTDPDRRTRRIRPLRPNERRRIDGVGDDPIR